MTIMKLINYIAKRSYKATHGDVDGFDEQPDNKKMVQAVEYIIKAFVYFILFLLVLTCMFFIGHSMVGVAVAGAEAFTSGLIVLVLLIVAISIFMAISIVMFNMIDMIYFKFIKMVKKMINK